MRQDAFYLCLRRLLKLLVRQDEGAGGACRYTIEHILDDGHTTILVLVGRVH